MYDMYEDDITDEEGGLSEKSYGYKIPMVDTGLYRQVPTPELNGNYLNFSVMFPVGGTYSIGKVIGQKIGSSVNAVGMMNDNPILDMHEYCV